MNMSEVVKNSYKNGSSVEELTNEFNHIINNIQQEEKEKEKEKNSTFQEAYDSLFKAVTDPDKFTDKNVVDAAIVWASHQKDWGPAEVELIKNVVSHIIKRTSEVIRSTSKLVEEASWTDWLF